MKHGLIVYGNGDKFWYQNDKLHREDGPAIEANNGSNTAWYINGKLHRIDGPAMEFSSGLKYWYFNGEKITCNSLEEFKKLIKLKGFW